MHRRYLCNQAHDQGITHVDAYISSETVARKMSWNPLLICCPMILLLVGQSAGGGSLNSSESSAKELLAEFKKALNQRIGIIDARPAIGLGGERRPGASRRPLKNSAQTMDAHPLEGYWRYNVLPGSPRSTTEPTFDYPDHDGANVIFIHGFRNSPAQAINRARALWNLLSTSNDYVANKKPISYFIFLWKGDFYGVGGFSKAQGAANVSSKSLANFLDKLSQNTPNAKTVIIAHSLGSRVALEALRARCGPSHDTATIDSLVLVQAAVRAIRLYSWTVTQQVTTTHPIYDMTETSYPARGRYADSILCVHHLLYTVSATDNVLKHWFHADERLLIDDLPKPHNIPSLPYMDDPVLEFTALGNPFDKRNRWESIQALAEAFEKAEEMQEKTFAPRSYTSWRKEMSIDKFVAKLSTTWFKYSDWNIVHPRVEALNVSDYLQSEDATIEFDWHSPIYDDEGLYLVNNIWKRVTEKLDLPLP